MYMYTYTHVCGRQSSSGAVGSLFRGCQLPEPLFSVYTYIYMYIFLFYVYLYRCVYLYIYIYIYVYTYTIHTCVYIYIHTYIYIYIYMCCIMYIYIYMFLCLTSNCPLTIQISRPDPSLQNRTSESWPYFLSL